MDQKYAIEEFTCDIPVAEYVSRYHNPDVVWGNCSTCNNYGKQWSCPPFDFNVVERLTKYSSLSLKVTKIIFQDRNVTTSEAKAILFHKRIMLEQEMLEAERQTGGLASTLVGQCLHCGESSCVRVICKPCLHPELVRPSLEAYGFDVAKTLLDLFNIELQWTDKDKLPEYLVLTCGLFTLKRTADYF